MHRQGGRGGGVGTPGEVEEAEELCFIRYCWWDWAERSGNEVLCVRDALGVRPGCCLCHLEDARWLVPGGLRGSSSGTGDLEELKASSQVLCKCSRAAPGQQSRGTRWGATSVPTPPPLRSLHGGGNSVLGFNPVSGSRSANQILLLQLNALSPNPSASALFLLSLLPTLPLLSVAPLCS